MATIRALNHSIPCMIPLGDDGLAKVAGWFLSMRFKLNQDSIHVEEESFHDNGDLSYNVLQVSFHINDGRVWFSLPGSYKAIGVTELEMATTTVLLTPGVSLTCIMQVPLLATVKKEPDIQEVTCSRPRPRV